MAEFSGDPVPVPRSPRLFAPASKVKTWVKTLRLKGWESRHSIRRSHLLRTLSVRWLGLGLELRCGVIDLCVKQGPPRFGQNDAEQASAHHSARGCPGRQLGAAGLGRPASWAALA